jgi:hypothetical protein
MVIRPDVLYSHLYSDLSDQVSASALDCIKGKQYTWPDQTFKERAAASVAESLLKKWKGSLTAETKAKALDKFLLINDQCERWSLTPTSYLDEHLLGELRQLVYGFWNRYVEVEGRKILSPIVEHHYDILEQGGVGPGAAVGSLGGDFYTKLFSSKMGVTDQGLYKIYRRYIRGFAEWSNAEIARLAAYGDPEVVEGNRLDFVPKNDDISRSICVEPSLNMFYQIGFGKVLRSRLLEVWGLDLTYQQFKNRELARRGSWDGSFDTIDLSSASDSISVKMLEWLLPADFLRWLMLLRSPTSKLPNGTRVRLNMVSTMGNGYTFPLQTMLFAAVVLAAFKVDGLAPVHPRGVREGNYGINGDDIVVPKRITQKVLRLLSLLGFTPNEAKTFVQGPFRESCGGDYFEGRNLRGVYIQELSGPHDIYSVVNQLNLFSTRTGIFLPRLVQFLMKKVRYRPVPIWENDSAGFKVPLHLAERFLRVDRDTQSLLYSAWTSVPPPLIRIGDWVLKTPTGFKPREFNSSGLLLSVLQGSVNPDGIPLKPKAVYYRAKPRIAPNWDVKPNSWPSWPDSDVRMVQLFAGWFSVRRWESAVYRNFHI